MQAMHCSTSDLIMFVKLMVLERNKSWPMKKLIYFLVLVSLPSLVVAQKAKDYSEVSSELVQKIESTHTASKQLRIAVVPFIPSNSEETSKAFGDYLTESVTGKLSEKPQKFKVFERQRLDAIFKENELMLGGMMKPSEALK